jgi:Ser-tRNA(Ala) deacylase AlaX
MTRKLFWADPYLSRADCVVAAVDGRAVELESTIFFAFSGGQESDAGTIGGVPVIEAELLEDGDIRYTLERAPDFRAGDRVAVMIDPERRRALTRLHFAAELVLELVNQRYGRPRRLGAHIGPAKARLDFAWPDDAGLPAIAAVLADVEAAANALVAENLPIVSAFDDPAAAEAAVAAADERRHWEIAGFARVPCGGTHPRSTAEVGPLRLGAERLGRGKQRVVIRLAEAAANASANA